MRNLINWFQEKVFPGDSKPEPVMRKPVARARPAAERTGAMARAKKEPEPKPEQDPNLEYSAETSGRVEDAGPGKNVFVRSKYVSGDAGTQDSLKILGEEEIEIAEDEGGIDPYNTGHFNLGDTWKKNFRK